MTAAVTAKRLPMKITEIGEHINAHLKRFQNDPAINKDRSERGTYYHASAHAAGAYVRVTYVAWKGATSLNRTRALRYLQRLDAGFVGTHYRSETSRW